MNKSWHPYWAWEHFQWGFYSGDYNFHGKEKSERLRMEFFQEENLFKKTAIELMSEWPVCCDHFLSDQEINRVAWLGQACSLFFDGVDSRFSYVYNWLDKKTKDKNNLIAQELINEWVKDRDNQGSIGLYKKVETERIRVGYTSRVPPGVIRFRDSTIIQGDLFSNSQERHTA